jgi:hypothetical protein
VANVVKVAISEDAENTTTVPEMLGVPTAAGAELAGALLDGACAADDVAALAAAVDAAGVVTGAADEGEDAAFFEELHPARPSATTTVVTRTVVTRDAWRFIDSPKRVWGRRLLGVR